MVSSSSRGSWRDRPKDLPAHVGWTPKKRAGEQERVVTTTPTGKVEVYAGGRVRKISPSGKVIVSKIASESAQKIIAEKKASDLKVIKQQAQAKQQKKTQFETTYFILHEKTGQKVRISPALARKIAIDEMRYKVEHPKDSYSKFQTLLETKPPAKTRTAQFFGEMGQSQRAISSFAFGHDPEFVEIGGKKLKYDKGMEVTLGGDQKYSVSPQKIGMFDWEEAKRWGKTGKKAGSVSPALLTKYDPIAKVGRASGEWVMEHPVEASGYYGVGAIFGVGTKGIELGIVKATTIAPKLMKLAPLGKFGQAGIFGGMLGTAGYFSGKEILGSSDKLQTFGEEIPKWALFGAGARVGGKLFDTKLTTAKEFQTKAFERAGFDPKSRVSFSAQKEIKGIKDYEAKLFKKTYTQEGLEWDQSRFKGFKEFDVKGFPRQTQLKPTTETGFDIYTKYETKAPKLAETGYQTTLTEQIQTKGIRLTEGFQTIPADFPIQHRAYGKFAWGGIEQTPQTFMLVSKLKGAPMIEAPLQPIRFAGKGLGKRAGFGGSLASQQQIYGRGEVGGGYDWFKEEYKWGEVGGGGFKRGKGDILDPDFNIFGGKGKTDVFTGVWFGGDLGGKGKTKVDTDLFGGFASGGFGLSIGKWKQPTGIELIDYGIKEFEMPKIDILPKTRTAQRSRSITDQTFVLPTITTFKDFITIPKTPSFTQEKITKEKIPKKPIIKPIVELPPFMPRAFRIRGKRDMGFRIKPIKLDIFPVSDLFSKTLTELGTGKPATQRKRTKKSKKEFGEFIKYGGLFPTEEMATGKINVWKLRL